MMREATPGSIQDLAQEALESFEHQQRPDGTSFPTLKEGAPSWVHDLVRVAHDTYLPDDWRYETITHALVWIADSDSDDLEGEGGEFADSEVDVYTHALLEWLSSNLQRVSYCDEAAEEYGGEPASITDRIALGQYAEAEEVYSLVLSELQRIQSVVTA